MPHRYRIVSLFAMIGMLISVSFVLMKEAGTTPDFSSLGIRTVLNKGFLLLERKLQFELFSVFEGISVEEAERRHAREILKGREIAIQHSGGYKPGVYIVENRQAAMWGAERIASVPAGHLLDIERIKEDKDGILKDGQGLHGDNDRYIDPIDVSGTDLGKSEMVGYALSGAYLNGPGYARTRELREAEATPSGRSGWTGLTRVYENVSSLGDVVLEESDIVAARSTALIPRAYVNAEVSGMPATLLRSQDASGKTTTSLSWASKEGKTYDLTIGKIDDDSVRSLKRLANSLFPGPPKGR